MKFEPRLNLPSLLQVLCDLDYEMFAGVEDEESYQIVLEIAFKTYSSLDLRMCLELFDSVRLHIQNEIKRRANRWASEPQK